MALQKAQQLPQTVHQAVQQVLQSLVQQAQVPRWVPQSPQAEQPMSKETQQVQLALLPGQ